MGVESISVNPNGQSHTCSICHFPLKKNGTTSAGTQRWRCTHCGASKTRKRTDTTARNQLTGFINWLVSKNSQAEHGGGTGRTFRANTQWCWNVEPYLEQTGEVFEEIQVDGIYIRPGWCCLIAIANHHVIGWQWCDTEKAVAWHQLLQPFPAPQVVVTDGGSGLFKALKGLWPAVKVQRCLVHIQRNLRGYLTLNPRTDAGKSLRRLGLNLTRISTTAQAITWLENLNAWHGTYQQFLNERTYAKDWNGARPQGVKTGQTWWYTHQRVLRGYKVLANAVKRQHLFTFLDPELLELNIHPTTNMIEGGINSGIRRLLRVHRGMPIEHRRRAIEWFCYTHAAPDTVPSLGSLIRPEHYTRGPQRTPGSTVEEPIGPELYGTGTIAEEGLFTRQGWGGRSR